MATGNSIIPIDDSELATESLKWIEDGMVFAPKSLPSGRFPTLSELRQAILDLGFDLEEGHDWYVTSENDSTEVWFQDGDRQEDSPIKFWCRRGHLIVLDITQRLSHQCGSFIVAHHTGGEFLIVPDSLFPSVSVPQDNDGYVATISGRIPAMIEELIGSSLEHALFLLSQIRQPLICFDRLQNYDLFQIAQSGVATYAELLKHSDERVRFLAFDLIAMSENVFYQYSQVLGHAIKNEADPDTKARMIWAIENLLSGGVSSSGMDQWRRALWDILIELSNGVGEVLPVRLAASNLLARAQPGFLTSGIRSTFIDALVNPEQYVAVWSSHYSISRDVLKSIEKLLLHHRIEILTSALPQIPMASDSHDVLRELLDHVFFGQVRKQWMSSLPATYEVERPEIDETKFREHDTRGWLYPINPTQLNPNEILHFQRQVLETVIDLAIPWMVHSNLLEKYGLPPTREKLRRFLASVNKSGEANSSSSVH